MVKKASNSYFGSAGRENASEKQPIEDEFDLDIEEQRGNEKSQLIENLHELPFLRRLMLPLEKKVMYFLLFAEEPNENTNNSGNNVFSTSSSNSLSILTEAKKDFLARSSS